MTRPAADEADHAAMIEQVNSAAKNDLHKQLLTAVTRIAEGLDKEQIKDALVAEYGPEVLAIPETEGFDLAAWLVPGAAIVVAAVAIFVGSLFVSIALVVGNALN
jgi:cytochrome c-type biogenesis protein CcmH